MRRFLALALLTLTLALASAPATALAARSGFNVKFTFTDQTFSDGTAGVIRAGSKLTGPSGNQLTVCGYYSTTDSNLGQFESSSFSFTDSGKLRQFCLDNYVNRT
jgi:hypothetical protein